MVSANFEHASFNILCCVVKKNKIKKKHLEKKKYYLWNAFKLCCSVVNTCLGPGLLYVKKKKFSNGEGLVSDYLSVLK